MSSERREPTLEVQLDDVEESTTSAPEPALDEALDALLEEQAALPPAAPTRAGSSVRPPAPERPSALPPRRGATARANGPALGSVASPPPVRPASLPPPRPSPRRQPVDGSSAARPSRSKASAPSATEAPSGRAPGEASPARDERSAALEEALDRAARASTPGRRARAYFDAAVLAEDDLSDRARAIDLHRRALASTASFLPSIRALRRLLLAERAFEDALPLFDAEARLVAEPSARAAIWIAKGALLEDRLDRRAEARAAFLQAHELDRGNVVALKELLRADWEGSSDLELARWLEALEDAVGDDPRLRAELRTRRARALEHASRADAAIEAYQMALETDPRAAGALDALKRLLARPSTEGRATAADGSLAAPPSSTSARSRATPSSSGALPRPSATLSSPGTLAAKTATTRSTQRLREVLEAELALEDDARRRTRLRERIADLLARELAQPEDAIALLRLAEREAPHELVPEVLARLADLLETHGERRVLAEVLERAVEHTSAPGARIALLSRLAGVYDGASDEGGASAIRALERALELDPTYVPTLQALGRLYASRERWDDLARMHLSEANATREPRRRAVAYARIAELYERRLGSIEGAITNHQRALTALPTHLPSFHALSRLYRRAGRHRELLELHHRMLELAPSQAHRVALWLAIAAVHEDLLDEPERAIVAYETVLTLDRDNRVAIAALERVGERAERADVVARALELEASLETDVARRVALLSRAGELLAPRDPEAAAARFRQALELAPNDGPALASLGRLHHDLGHWDDLVEVRRRELENASDPTTRSLLASSLAELADEKLGRADEALAWARRAFELDPTNDTVARALERRLRARGALADVRRLYDAELDAIGRAQASGTREGASEPAREARIALSLGRLIEELRGSPKDALDAYERAAASDQLRPDALDARIRLLSELGSDEALAELFEREAARRSGPQAVAALVEASRIASERLGDRDRAARLLEQAIDTDPTALSPWLGLEDLHRAAPPTEASRAKLARALAGQARVFGEPRARAAALYALARLEGRGPDAGALRDTLEAMAALVPDDRLVLDALDALGTALEDDALRVRVAEALSTQDGDPILRASLLGWLGGRAEDPRRAHARYSEAARLDGESISIARGRVKSAEGEPEERLAEALRAAAALEPDHAARAELLFRAADAIEASDPEEAASHLEQALVLAPARRDVAEALVRRLVEAEQPGRALDALRRAAEASPSLDAYARIAWIQAEVLKDVSGATATLARAEQKLGESVDVVTLQASYAERDGQWATALDRLERLAELEEDPARRLDARLRAGLLAIDSLRDPDRAERHLLEVLGVREEPRALAALADAHAQRGRFDDARDVALRWAERARDQPDEAAAWALVMRASERLGDRDLTLRAAVRAVAIEGSGGPAREAFGRLLGASSPEDKPARTHALVQALREHLRNRRGSVATHLDLARILHGELGRADDAATALYEGYQRHPNDAELRRTLLRRLVDAGRDHEAVNLAERRVAEGPTSLDAWSELALALSRSERQPYTSAPLRLLGAEARQAAPRTRMGPIPLEAFLALADLTPDAPIVGILGALGEALPRLYPADLDAYGTSLRERIPARSGHPLRTVFEAVGALFGSPPFELFLHRVRGRGLAVELAEPTYVLAPAWLAERSEARQAFVAARVEALMSAQLAAIHKLTPRELEILVASAVRASIPGFGAGLTSEDVLDDQARRITKQLSWRTRRVLGELAIRYAERPITDYATLSTRIQSAANRVALLVADDLEQSLDVMRQLERDDLDLPSYLASSSLAQDLLRFHASSLALELRKRLGSTL